MRTVLLALLVAFVGALLVCFALGLAGWRDGIVAGKIGVVGLCVLGTLAVIADFNRKRSGRNLAPVKRTARARVLDFPPREFRHTNRTLLTALLGGFGAAGLLVALCCFVALLTEPDLPPGLAAALTTVFLILGAACTWCAARVWAAKVVLAPDGVTVHATYTRGRFGWDELIGFERVLISNGNGDWYWWFRLVTAKKAYLFQDALEDRAWFVRTVTRASGLELVDAG